MADVFFINVLKHLSYILRDFLMNGIRINSSVILCAIDLQCLQNIVSFYMSNILFGAMPGLFIRFEVQS